MSSHVTILAAGTRGDVQPFIALAMGLLDHGYDVTLAANHEFEALVNAYDVPYHPLSADYLALADTPEGRRALKGNPLTASRRVRKLAAPMIRRMLDEAWRAAQDTDAIVYHPKTLAGPHLAERLGVPAFVAAPVPMLSPTKAFPIPGLVKAPNLGSTLNKASYKLAAKSAGVFRGTVDEWRQTTLDMPKAPHGVSDAQFPKLYAYSPTVLPRPDDWGEDTIVTGYWELAPARGWTPPPELTRFLRDGPPPVYVGFGSMPVEDLSRDITHALRSANVRGLLEHPFTAGGPDMLAVKDVPHSWLFPQTAAVVHHGGAGTPGAALIAGKPSVVIPQAVDQPFWARAVERLNAGVSTDRLTPEALTRALALAVEPLRREDGVANAVAHIGAVLPKPRRLAAA